MTRKAKALILLVLLLAIAAIALPAFNHASPTVAFMGDSLTQGWQLPRENFGIYGQTTAQMLARFQQQIPGHATVVILAGTNDTMLHVDPATTIANLGAMVDLANQDHAQPILAEIPPIYRDNGVQNPAVDRLNASIVELATRRHVPLADYNAALRNHPESFSDGIHLKRRGYLRMELALLRVVNIF